MKRYLIVLIGIFLASSLTLDAQTNNPWEVPEDAATLTNPVEANKSSLSEGKSLYNTNCKSCHGKSGQGNGSMAKQLDENPSDFSLDDIDVQKDGELFYKIKSGQGEMHSYAKVLNDENIWKVVNYIRSFYKD